MSGIKTPYCFVLAGAALMACAPVQVAPNLKLPERTCPRLALPPIPEDVLIDIQGDRVTANTGGETLLRYYVQARELLRR